MDFSKELIEFVSEKVGGVVVIATGSSEIMYADTFFKEKYGKDIVGMDADEIFTWMNDCPELSPGAPAVEWENIDTDSKKYYKFNSAIIEKEEKKYTFHQVVDITEYMGLNRDITKYMSFFKRLASFQTAVLEKLSDTYHELLPMLTDYFKTSKAYMMVQREDKLEVAAYSKMGNAYFNDRIQMTDAIDAVFEFSTEDDILYDSLPIDIQEVFKLSGSSSDSSYVLLGAGDVSGQKYAIFLNIWPNMDRESMAEKTLINVIKLYTENAIMRERLIYENEHDHLTGLYNKGKYLARIENKYPNRKSIAVYNFDVNNLKTMNDTYGHEAGDKLIIKAADSIRKVTGTGIHGYRMGGDEFLMVACDLSEAEANNLLSRWETELERLNDIDDGIECVMAVGMVYAGEGYNLDEVLAKADELMYEDKKAKKNV
ncbi:MAG: GGDEF domain-containing protein [Lachnospiraceae bacterium]|nr:GGDEF domain-containing protein [Lachnospiraceae bacterium]